MNQFIILQVALFLVPLRAWSQKEVTELTSSIIDYSDSKSEQVQDIYEWVTHNIDYDVKKFVKLDYTPLTTTGILRKKKGVCTDYSNLINAMCRSVGIESYTIHGYSKGYLYYPGMPFMRGNHTWNAVLVDSNWIILDATWGAGYLKNVPRFTNKAVHYASLKKKVLTNNKTVFVNAPNNDYFDISSNQLTQDHYPLDPKWLLSEHPVSYTFFKTDSGSSYIDYPNYLEEIERIRFKDEDFQYKIEGLRAEKDNALNSFDLASGYMNIAQHHDITVEVTAGNLSQFEQYLNEYTLIYQASLRYRSTIDSVYKARFSSLKGFSRKQKRLTDKVKSKVKSEEKSLASGEKQRYGKHAAYMKKLSSYTLNIERAELKSLDETAPKPSPSVDSLEHAALSREIRETIEQEHSCWSTMDSLSQHLEERIKAGWNLNDSLFYKHTQFNHKLTGFSEVILADNEAHIIQEAGVLQQMYQEILSSVDVKKNAKKELSQTSFVYYKQASLHQSLLKQHLSHLQEMNKISGYNPALQEQYDFTKKSLKNSYLHAIAYTKAISEYLMGQGDLNEKSLWVLKEQRKNIIKDYQYFAGWYKKTYDREKYIYTTEKRMISRIRSQSFKSQKKVNLKIERYKKSTQK